MKECTNACSASLRTRCESRWRVRRETEKRYVSGNGNGEREQAGGAESFHKFALAIERYIEYNVSTIYLETAVL